MHLKHYQDRHGHRRSSQTVRGSGSGSSLHLLVETSLSPNCRGSSPLFLWLLRSCKWGSGSSLHLLVATSLLQRCSGSSRHLLVVVSLSHISSGSSLHLLVATLLLLDSGGRSLHFVWHRCFCRAGMVAHFTCSGQHRSGGGSVATHFTAWWQFRFCIAVVAAHFICLWSHRSCGSAGGSKFIRSRE